MAPRVAPRPVEADGEERTRHRVEHDVAVDAGHGRRPAVVDNHAELARQRVQRRILRQAAFEGGDGRADVRDRGRVDPGERGADDVAHRLRLGPVRLQQRQRVQPVEERIERRAGHAADLQVRAPGHLDGAVAEQTRGLVEGTGGRRVEPSARDPDAHEQPVARLHRPQGAGTPALHRDRRHRAASIISASRIVTEFRRGRHRPRRAASSSRRAIAPAAGGLAARRKSRTASSST